MEKNKSLDELDDIVEYLKAAEKFTIITRDYKLKFFFNKKEKNLYLYKNRKMYKISNFGTALYAFANESEYFELILAKPDQSVHKIYMLYNIRISV